MSQALVETFLRTMEARDLPAAQAMLGDGCVMTFPGGHSFDALEEIVTWAATRYRSIRKTYDRFDELSDGLETIVYCYGGLHGEDLDGQPIDNVRFIDRFVIKDGKIVRQDVWNDLAER